MIRTIYIISIVIIASISCESNQVIPIETEVLPCKITSIVEEENYDNPMVYTFNSNGDIAGFTDDYELGEVTYTDGKLSSIMTYHPNELGDHLMEISYKNNKIENITHTTLPHDSNLEPTTWLKMVFYYQNDQVHKVEHWRDDENGGLQNTENFLFTYEDGNIIEQQQIDLGGNEDAENDIISFTYDDKQNPFKGNLVYLWEYGYTAFLNKNNYLTMREVGENNIYEAEHAYEYNSFGFPVKVYHSDEHHEYLELDISYECE